MSSKDSVVTEISELEEVNQPQPQPQREHLVNPVVPNEPFFSRALRSGSSSHLNFPDGELVQEGPRGSSPPNAYKNWGGRQSWSSMEEISSPASYESFIEPQRKRVKLDNQNNTSRPSTAPENVTWVLVKAPDVWEAYVDGVPVAEAERLKWAQNRNF